MANWITIQDEFNSTFITKEAAWAKIRRKYLKKLYHISEGRNVISYYSGWTQRPDLAPKSHFYIDQSDKCAFMTLVHGLDHKAELDLFLHTPGGDISATEPIMDFITDVFGRNIRTFVVQLAISAGTMMACMGDEIIMGRQSSLGPVDPQLVVGDDVIQAHSVIAEFEQAQCEIKANADSRFVWEKFIEKYPSGFINTCKNHIAWSKELVEKTLRKNMFFNDKNNDSAKNIANILTDVPKLKVHNRHLSLTTCRDFGLAVKDIYEFAGKNLELKDTIYAIHWANVCTLEALPVTKIIEGYGKRYYEGNKCKVKSVVRDLS